MEDPRPPERQDGAPTPSATPAADSGVATVSGAVQDGVDAALEATGDLLNQQGLAMLREGKVTEFIALRKKI